MQQELSLKPTHNQLDANTTLMIRDFNVYFNIIITHICKLPKRPVSFFDYNYNKNVRLPLLMPYLFFPSHDFGFGGTSFEYSQIIP
jgi:hypothetical protein